MPPALYEKHLITWLLAGDVALQYQTHRDLLGEERPDLRARIATEGWGARILRARKKAGHWGRGFYQPKWTSTHYTVLDLKNLSLAPDHPLLRASIADVLAHHKGQDGGINPSRSSHKSDVCICGMGLNYAAYFGLPLATLTSVVDFLITVQMPDGGFNCQSNHSGAVHSSLHSTISVLEGIQEYVSNGYSYRVTELNHIAQQAREFILQHRLFRSDKTGAIIRPSFLMLSYPSRWYYDILRALDYFQMAGIGYDPRMQDALDVVLQKRRLDGTWPLQAKHPGETHFDMEKPGRPSRWNTLRALRVLQHFGIAATTPPHGRKVSKETQ